MSNGWPYSQGKSMGSIPPENPMLIYREDLMESSPCAPASIVHSQNLAFCDINEQNSAGSFNANGMVDKDVWTLTNPILRGNIGLPPPPQPPPSSSSSSSSSSVLHQTLSQIPTDFGFIERAARFSCFSTGTLSNSLSIPSSMNQQYTRGVTTMLGPGGVSSGGRLNLFSEGLSQENETNVIEGSRDDSMSIERETNQESPNGRRKTESFIRSRNKANEGQFDPGYESIQAEFSRGSDQAEPSEGTCQGTSSKGNALKKRKKIILDNELDQVEIAADPTEASKHHSENQKKGNQNPAPTANKPGEKHGKLGQQASDSPKQEYTHVRARRGQATSSHSLAERVRREKISERMKYLQDLVPGCSKVTGKAVMLDEIINYVQSLQQQVEFLSMKLASVDPRMDYDIEGITRKDILQSQAGPSSGLGFHSEMPMPYPPLHLPQPGPVQAACHGTGTSSDALRRTISSHMTAMRGGNKDLTSQPPVPDSWEDELHNIVHTGLNPNAPLNIEDLNDKTFPLSPN